MFNLLKKIVLLFFIALMCLINLSSISDDKSTHFKLRKTMLKSFGLSQRWSLFAPNPRKANPYVVVVGQLEDGRNINLKTHEEFLPKNLLSPSPPPKGHNHLSHYLSFLGTFLYLDKYKAFGQKLVGDIMQYELNRWYNQSSTKINTITFVQVTIITKDPGIYEAPKISVLFEKKLN